MILIDTNYLVDFILPPFDEIAEARHAKARSLLSGIESGTYEAIAPEVVIHECFYVLVMKLQVIDVPTFVEIFQSILQYRGWHIRSMDVDIYLRALELLRSDLKLEFSDSVIAARAEAHGAELATFDKRLAQAYGGPIWADS